MTIKFSFGGSKEGKVFRSVCIRLIRRIQFRYIIFSSTAWNRISTEEKRNLRLHKRDDGEFWMSLDDFMNNFTEVQICHQKLTGFTNESSVSFDFLFLNPITK